LDHARTAGRRQAIRNEFAGKRIVISVERLDYTKGTLEKVRAFGDLLATTPALRGKVSLVVVCVPAAKEMTIYDTLQGQIEQAVGRVNGQFNEVGWSPIRFFSVLALRGSGRLVCRIRYLLDYPAARWSESGVQGVRSNPGQTEGSGVLVLSEFAGAAAELHTVPY
jgi:trehalose-6-phosphate synthase